MAGASFEEGLARIKAKETSNQSQGRGTDAVPQKRAGMRGDKNPVSGGGINRPTKGYAKD